MFGNGWENIYTTILHRHSGIKALRDNFGNYYVLDKSIFSEKEQEQILIALQGIASTEGENADELLSKLSALFQIKWTDWIEVDFSDWNKNKADQIFGEIKKARSFGTSPCVLFSKLGNVPGIIIFVAKGL